MNKIIELTTYQSNKSNEKEISIIPYPDSTETC